LKHFLRRIQSLFLLFLIIVMNMCQETPVSKSEQKKFPNVLLISLDDCRADSLSCYGYHRKTSPFIDEVSASGIRFVNAFVNTHGTFPSHTTMLSSQYQESHKVFYYNNEDHILTNTVMIQEILKAYGYVTLGVADGGWMDNCFGFSRGFFEYNSIKGNILSRTQELIKLTCKYISTKKPIFAFLHTYEIHAPYLPPKRYKKIFGEYKSDFIPSSENLVKIKNTKKDLSKNDLEFIKVMYDAGIRYTDDTLRKLFVELKKIGFFENYLLIITSDHGEEFGEHGGVLHPGKLYDELIHIPLIISGTNIPKGVVDQRMVSTVDIVPTILDYLDIEIYTPAAGHSLLDQPTDRNEGDAIVFSQLGRELYSVRTPRWKCIETVRSRLVELYDLKIDPGEKHNIASQKPALVANFIKRIRDWKEGCYQFLGKQDLAEKKSPKNGFKKEQIEQLKTLGYITTGKDSKEKVESRDTMKRFSKWMPNINLPQATNNIYVGIDQLSVGKDFIKIEGWAYIIDKDSLESRIYVVLKSQKDTIVFDSFLKRRPDVATYFLNENLEDTGFITTIQTKLLKKGKYQVGIYIEKESLKALQFFDKYVNLK
jgi:arylsulfatase A-like enzyme